MRAALRDAYYLSVVREVDRADRQRGSGFSTAFSPLQNLETYLERHEVAPERKTLLLDYARALVGESEKPAARKAVGEETPALQ